MIKPSQIPDEVVEAAARATWENWRAVGRQMAPAFDELRPWVKDGERKHARAAIAAALNAWPNVFVNGSSESIFVCCHSLVLPLPQEVSDE